MKKMMKLVSVVVASALLFSMMSFAVMADTANTEGLIFELDLSAASAGNPVIKDSVSGAQGAILPQSGQEGMELPDVVEDQTREIKYLSYSKYGSPTEAESLYFTNEAFMNQKEMSFELWIKPNGFVDGSGGYRMFDLAFSTKYQEKDTVDVFCYGGAFRWRPNSGNSGTTALDYEYEKNTAAKATIQSTNGKWTHVVFTRKWVPTAEDSSKGVWEGDTYINGTPLPRTATGQAVEYHTKEDKYLCIGTNTQGKAPFYGDIAEFKVYNTVLSRNAVENKYNVSSAAYYDYAIESVSPADGSEIDARSGDITIDFGNAVDLSTIDNITFAKEDGTSVIYGVTATSSDIVTLSYGKLEDGETYKLTIPTTVKSLYGATLASPAEYTFTANESYIINEDFTNATSVPNMNGISYDSYGSQVKTIGVTDKGDYYLSIKSGDGKGDYSMFYTLPRAMGNEGTALRKAGEQHVFEMKLKRAYEAKPSFANETETLSDADIPAGALFRFDSSSKDIINKKLGSFYMNRPYISKTWNYDGSVWKGKTTHYLKRDSEDFIKVRVTVSAVACDNNIKYSIEIDDLATPQAENDDAPGNFIIDPEAAPNSSLDYLSYMLIAHVYDDGTDKAYAENQFSEIRAYERKQSKIIKIGDYDANTNSIGIMINNGLYTGEENNIVVTDSNGNDVEYDATFNSITGVATLTFKDAIEGKYNVSLKDVRDADLFKCNPEVLSFTAMGAPACNSVQYYDVNGDTLTSLDGATYVKVVATLVNWEGGDAPIAILAVYDGNKLVGAIPSDDEEVDGTNVTFTIESGEFAALNEGNVKLFIWEDLKTLTPVLEAITFNGNGGSL